MARRPALLSLSVLFCCCRPCPSASPHPSARAGPWGPGPPDAPQEVRNHSQNQNQNLNPLHSLAAACVETVPEPVSSRLRGRCLQALPNLVSNQNQNRNLTAGCVCEFLRDLRAPPNGSACAAMLQGCGAGGGALALGLSLLLLLLLLAGGAGCVWQWKRRGRPVLALPRFLRDRRLRRGFSKARPAGALGVSAKAAGPCAAAGQPDPQDHYENLPVQRPGGPDARGLYENAGPDPCEEHVYGNEASGDYYNFRAPSGPVSPPDEDIYILPDAY